MTTAQYQNLEPREATPSATSRLFSFARIRGGTTTRFYPGDGARLHFANRDVDTLEMPGVPSGYLAAGDVVTATYKGACVFRGEVASIVEHKGRGTDATQTVTCAGPWSKMQRLVYRQRWRTGSGYDWSSRLILNQYSDGTAQNLNSELREIADHGASACGYACPAGNISVSTQQLPFDECRDITVADAIKRELRFFPKAVAYFDYGGATPALKIKKATASASAAYVETVPKEQREYVYNAHPVSGVDLEIEATGTVDGVEYHEISHQRAGNTLAGNPDCLYETLQVRGASSHNTWQSFTSVTEDVPADLNDVGWWKAKHPRLANVAASTITITNGARTPSNYPRIAAATAGELEAAGLHCEVSKFTATATIETADDKEETIYLTLNFLTTNAQGTAAAPKTYRWTTDSWGESGETVPAGLAATILAERSGTLVSERMTVRLGDTFPKIGDAAVEGGQTLYLQSFEVDCGRLTADLVFGVPEYLTPEDMASLLSGFRNKRTATSTGYRKTGKTSESGSDVEMGGIAPLSSSEFSPGTKAKTTVRAASGSGGSIKLDASEVDDGKTVGVHTLTVRGDGEETEDRTFQILSDDNFELYGGGVRKVNGEGGELAIVGGSKIRVETEGKTIRITYDAAKTQEDEDPNDPANDPCAHAGDGAQGGTGGVSPYDAGGSGGAGGGVDMGAGSIDAHPGDGNCCGTGTGV